MARQGDDLCPHDLTPKSCYTCRTAIRGAERLLSRYCTHGELRTKCRSCRAEQRPQCPECRDYVPQAGICLRCEKRNQRNSARRAFQPAMPRSAWTTDQALRQWQVEALSSWKGASRRAVIEAATGTGKTMLACAAIADIHTEFGEDTRVVVVVPTQVLARQWRQALTSALNLPDNSIGEQHSEAQIDWTNSRHPVLITVINTGRNQLKHVLTTWKAENRRVLLIVDECHRAGAATNAKVFEGHFDFSLGLSATPERPDEGERMHVYPNIGKKTYSYPLKLALDDGVLADFTSMNIYVDFTRFEQDDWEKSTEDLSKAIRSLKDEHPKLVSRSANFFLEVRKLAEAGDLTARRFEALLAKRRELLAECAGRKKALSDLLKVLSATRRRLIIFHESIAVAEETLQELRTLGTRASIDHSQMKAQDRTSERDRFASGRSQAMVAVRSLDEGVDVPEAEVAIIASGSRSKRQRIQRMGRVLRFVEGKQAICISILVRGTVEESITGAADSGLVGASRVRHHRYGETPLDVVLQPLVDSTYEPPMGRQTTEADQITFRFIQKNPTSGSRS